MAPIHREERLQMRQRGAASRKVNQIDFGLSFDPAVSGARRKSHKTPSAGRSSFNNNGYAARTPGRRSRTASTQPSSQSRRRPSVSKTQPSNSAVVDVQIHHGTENREAKRKLSGHDDRHDQADLLVEIPAQKRRRTGNALSREPEELPAVEEFLPEAATTDRLNNGITALEVLDPETLRQQYSTLNQPHSGQRKRKKRKSIGQQRKKRRSSGDGGVIDLVSSRNVVDEHTYAEEDEEVGAMGADEDFHEREYVEAFDQKPLQNQTKDTSELSPRRSLPAPRSKRRKRRSIGQQRKKKRSSDGDATVNPVSDHNPPTSRGNFSENEESGGGLDGPSVESPNEEIHGTLDSPKQLAGGSPRQASLGVRPKRRKRKSIGQQRKKRRSSDRLPSDPVSRYADKPSNAAEQGSESEAPQEVDQEDQEAEWSEVSDEDETFLPVDLDEIDESHLLAESPKQSKKQTQKASLPTRRKPAPPQRSSTTTVPILTHRLTNLSALPTIIEDAASNSPIDAEAEAEAEDGVSDPLTSSFTTRPTPNAINILAQICRETIQTVLESLSSNSSNAPSTSNSKSTLRHRHSAISSFGSALESRLFTMSQILDQKQTLEKRLRKAKKSRAETQARWFEVRRRREEVALKSDEARRVHMAREEGEEEARRLSERAGRVEVGVERGGQWGGGVGGEDEEGKDGNGDGDGFAGLEFRVKDVVGKVGSEGDEGGLLDRVREFNRLLEEVAGALEGG